MERVENETIYGQIISKANNYLAVPDGNGGRRIIKNQRMRDYEESFRKQCRIYKNRGINKRFVLYVRVWFRSDRSDLDNALKGLLDLLQDVGAITNDNLCVKIIAEKVIDRNNPRVQFAIKEIV